MSASYSGTPLLRKLGIRTGMLWASRTKKASSSYAGFGDAEVRAAGLATSLVGVKVCAVDEDWSGLKFAVRKENRR